MFCWRQSLRRSITSSHIMQREREERGTLLLLMKHTILWKPKRIITVRNLNNLTLVCHYDTEAQQGQSEGGCLHLISPSAILYSCCCCLFTGLPCLEAESLSLLITCSRVWEPLNPFTLWRNPWVYPISCHHTYTPSNVVKKRAFGDYF